MRIVVVYREQSEHRSAVESFIRDYERRTGDELEIIDPDSRSGADFCRIYDIVEYPTILALGTDGSPYHVWRGAMLPTVDDVVAASYS